MVDGPSDADEPEGGAPEEGAILDPSELDITESEHVEQLDEGRFVVSPDARTKKGNRGGQQGDAQSGAGGSAGGRQSGGAGSGAGGRQGGGTGGGAGGRQGGGSPAGGAPSGDQPGQRRREGSQRGSNLSEETVRRWMRRKYERSNSKYAFDVTARFDGAVSQRRMASNDLITTFESLLLWYAQQVDTSMPVEEILGILLMESNVPVRYPPESVRNLVKSTDLGPDDTISDLLEAVQDDDGVKL